MCVVNKAGYLNFVLEGPVDEGDKLPACILDVYFKWYSWICTWKNMCEVSLGQPEMFYMLTFTYNLFV